MALLFGGSVVLALGLQAQRKRSPPSSAAPRARVPLDVQGVLALARPNILELKPYRAARDDYEEGVLLDANENAFGPSAPSHPELELNRYPDPLALEVKRKLAELRGVQIEQSFLGVGSDEAIDLLFRIFCRPGVDNVVILPPTYGMYKVSAHVNDVRVKTALLTPDFDVDEDAVRAAVDGNTKLVFVCTPGNPTSKSVPLEVIERLASSLPCVVVVDEAYVDFSPVPSACSLVHTHPNVVVTQTFSKAFGLAGIRLGSAFGNEKVIQLMNNVKAPYNVNKLTARVAADALGDLSVFWQRVRSIEEARAHLAQELQALPFVQRVYPSHANFVLARLPKALEVYKRMAGGPAKVVTRFRGSEPHCHDCLRITVGTPEENATLIAALKATAKELGVTAAAAAAAE